MQWAAGQNQDLRQLRDGCDGRLDDNCVLFLVYMGNGIEVYQVKPAMTVNFIKSRKGNS